MSKRLAVIFDMDGTLANVSPIRHHLLSDDGKRGFDAFHRESVNCEPHEWVAEDARAYYEMGISVLVVTARKVMWARHTAMWLALHRIPSDRLYMRRDSDHRKDALVKRDMLARIQTEFTVIRAYDDNPNVIGMWEENGIDTTLVSGWID